MFYKILFWNVVCLLCLVAADNSQDSDISTSERSFNKVFSKCGQSNEAIKCLKVEALKLTNRMMKESSVTLIDGLRIIPANVETVNKDTSKSRQNDGVVEEADLMKLSSSKLNARILENARQFFNSHTIQVNVPRILSNGLVETKSLIEARGKKYKKYLGPFVAALAIKGGILTMVYHSIAIIAGKALIIGKIALIISAIIGLKKLVKPANHEKTTYEIVKHPHVQQSHSYSAHGDFETEGGQYHRSLGSSDMLMQDRAYRGYIR